MSKTDTWLPLYVADYLTATTRLTTEQHGAYLLIIMDYWRNGPPPDDDAVMARITGLTPARWKTQRVVIQPFFQISGKCWQHKRINAELERANKLANAKQKAGRLGGEAKAKALAEGVANAKQKPTPSPSPLPSPEEKSKATTGAAAPDPVKEEIWKTGKELLAKNGFDVKLAGGFLGKLCKEYGQILVLQAVRDCVATTPAEPHAWLMARCQERRKGNGKFNPILANKRNLDASLAAARVGTGPTPPLLDVVPDAVHVEFSRSSDD